MSSLFKGILTIPDHSATELSVTLEKNNPEGINQYTKNGYSGKTWKKNGDAYEMHDAKLHKIGKDWHLTTPRGVHNLGKKASFDHAERKLLAGG